MIGRCGGGLPGSQARPVEDTLKLHWLPFIGYIPFIGCLHWIPETPVGIGQQGSGVPRAHAFVVTIGRGESPRKAAHRQ